MALGDNFVACTDEKVDNDDQPKLVFGQPRDKCDYRGRVYL